MVAPVSVKYQDMNSDSFRVFLTGLALHTQALLKGEGFLAGEGISGDIIGRLLGHFSGLEFSADLELAHKAVQKFGLYANRKYDCLLIDALTEYNAKGIGADGETPDGVKAYLIPRLKKDLVLLLCNRGQNHYVLAHNDAAPHYVRGLLHLEGWKHLWDGIVEGVKKGSLKTVADESARLQLMEIYRRRAAAITYVNHMILMYLYSNYLCFRDIGAAAEALCWLIREGYSWFPAPADPKEDYLIRFALMKVPDAGFAFPGDTYLYEIYEATEKYLDAMAAAYLGADSALIELIRLAVSIPERCRDWRD